MADYLGGRGFREGLSIRTHGFCCNCPRASSLESAALQKLKFNGTIVVMIDRQTNVHYDRQTDKLLNKVLPCIITITYIYYKLIWLSVNKLISQNISDIILSHPTNTDKHLANSE